MYDVMVLGAGPGGYTAAIRAAQLDAKTVLVEKQDLGGTCLNRGCIPTKALIESVEAYLSLSHMEAFGVSVKDASFNAVKMYERKDQIVKQLRSGVEALVKSNNIELLRGETKFLTKNSVELTTGDKKTKLDAKNIIIATGSVPVIIPIPGADLQGVVTSNEALAFATLPKSIAIIGGGVIGVELATVFAGLGVKVSILEMLPEVLITIDPEISAALKKILAAQNIDIFTSAGVKTITESGGLKKITYETGGISASLEAEKVIMATGRKPCTEKLGLAEIGVKMEKARIIVDSTQRTSVANIYAIGDASSKIQLAHVAMAEGVVAADNATGHTAEMDYSAVPSCIYTNPEIACVGLSEKQAREKGIDVMIGRFPLMANGRAMTMGQTTGFVKILADRRDGGIVGAHLFGPHVTEMIAEMALAIRLEATLDEIKATIHPHPTLSECLFEAAHDATGECIHLPCKKKR
jgi:dihydrolipoamide dehydrogenase